MKRSEHRLGTTFGDNDVDVPVEAHLEQRTVFASLEKVFPILGLSSILLRPLRLFLGLLLKRLFVTILVVDGSMSERGRAK